VLAREGRSYTTMCRRSIISGDPYKTQAKALRVLKERVGVSTDSNSTDTAGELFA
jgi:hypothetical protein